MSNIGATPKQVNSVHRQSKKIVKTALANKTMDEQCKLMDAMAERKMFFCTDMALNYSDTLLNIFEYIEAVNFRIDRLMLNKFWQCVSENRCTSLGASVLEWLGYDNTQERNRKAKFIELLDTHNISYIQIKHTDPSFQDYPDLVEEAANLSVAALKRKQWIIMGSRDFKKMVMFLRTSRADDIREYYLCIEELFKMYCEYTLHFQFRREQRRIAQKQCTIDDLSAQIKQMRIEDKQRHDEVITYNQVLIHQNEQAEIDRAEMKQDLRAVRNIAAPEPNNPDNYHRMAIVKMSPDYEWDEEKDKKYLRNIDAIAVRIQARDYNTRIRQIRRYGKSTNKDAQIIVSFDSPNSVLLYNRLKEEHSDKFAFVPPVGIRFEPSTEEDLIEAVRNMHEARMAYPDKE